MAKILGHPNPDRGRDGRIFQVTHAVTWKMSPQPDFGAERGLFLISTYARRLVFAAPFASRPNERARVSQFRRVRSSKFPAPLGVLCVLCGLSRLFSRILRISRFKLPVFSLFRTPLRSLRPTRPVSAVGGSGLPKKS